MTNHSPRMIDLLIAGCVNPRWKAIELAVWSGSLTANALGTGHLQPSHLRRPPAATARDQRSEVRSQPDNFVGSFGGSFIDSSLKLPPELP